MNPIQYPNGTVTFLFTDIEGYSALEEKYGAALQPVLDACNTLLREVVAAHNGIEINTIGDAFFMVFASPVEAIQFSVTAQRALIDYAWSQVLPLTETAALEIRVRMGMHTGEARTLIHPSGRFDYFGTAVNRAARVSATGHGGQVLVSEATRLLAQGLLPAGIDFEDLGIHRLKGVGEERLWQLLHPSLPAHFAPVGVMKPEKHNLPLPFTPFLGREKELRDWTAKLCEPNTRLLTISGFGGLGKTRLAQQIAEECFLNFADGVWWIPLENATNGDEVVQRIAEQLVQNLKPQPSVREQLWNFHRDRELLLILDNLEQVPRHEMAQVVIGLLNAGPRLKILATSRRSLEIAPEHLVELEPFSPAEAEALFIERAQARKANFSLDAAGAITVAALCRRLEGVPLAIEIAASRIVIMTPHQILQRLGDQLKLLVSRDSSLAPRHAALRGAIEWSYNLLDDNAKILFAQLAVFVGGFTIEAAEAVVCYDGHCISFEVLEELMELRNQSLLRTQPDPQGRNERLTMLESVREYAGDKLSEENEQNVRRCHAEYFCRWTQEQVELLRTSEEANSIGVVETEFDNLRAALSWAEQNDAALCARLSLAFFHPLHLRGHWQEAGACLQKGWLAADTLDDGEALQWRAALRLHQAGLMEDIGEVAQACVLAKESLENYRAAGDGTGAAGALNLLAVLATITKDYDAARAYCREALASWADRDYVGRSKALHNLGRMEQDLGNFEAAQRLYEETLQLRRLAGDERGLAITLSNLGTLAQHAADYEQARCYYTDSLRLWRKLRQPSGIAIMLNNLGDLETLEKRFETAMVLFIHAERIFIDLKSSYVTEVTNALEALKQEIGESDYNRLRCRAEVEAWEAIV